MSVHKKPISVNTTIKKTITASLKGKETRDEKRTLVDKTEIQNPKVVPAGVPVGYVTVGVAARLSLAFNSVEVSFSAQVPVPGLTNEMVAAEVDSTREVLEKKMGDVIQEIADVLVAVGEVRDTSEAEYKIRKVQTRKG